MSGGDGGAQPVRVLVVDDQRPFRLVARAVLRRTAGFEYAGEAQTGEEAVAVAATLVPDLVLMDVHLPGISGIEAARQIAGADPDVVVVLCSTYRREELPVTVEGPYLDKEDLSPAALRAFWDGERVAG